MRKLFVVVAGACALLGLSGCVAFKSEPTAAQQGPLVVSTFTVCGVSEDPNNQRPGCSGVYNGSDPGYSGEPAQLFLAFRVPDGTGAPAEFSDSTGEVEMSSDAGYAEDLETSPGTAPPAGFHWEAYTSNEIPPDTGSAGDPAREATFSVAFVLPGGDDGNVEAGTFSYRPVVGGRNLKQGDGEPTADDDVNCSGNPYSSTSGYDGDRQRCISDPPAEDAATNLDVAISKFPAPPTGGPGPRRDTLAPRAAALTLSPKAFLAEGSGGAVAARGTRVRYSLSEASAVRFVVERARKGRFSKGKCRKPTTKNRKRRKCTRYVRVRGSFAHAGAAGSNSFRFTGRLRGKKLRPARYRLVGSPTDGAGNKGSAVTAKFRVLKKRR